MNAMGIDATSSISKSSSKGIDDTDHLSFPLKRCPQCLHL